MPVPYANSIEILLINSYSWYNKGDFAIVQGMINSLKWAIPNSKITVASLTPNVDRSHQSVNVVGVLNEVTKVAESGRKPDILTLISTFVSIFRLILCAILYRSLEIKLNIIGGDERSFFQECIDADVILSCGGAFINDNSLIRLLVHLFQMFFAIIVGKPVVLYGQSIGPFRRALPALLARCILNRTRLIILRENISREWLKRIGVDKPPIYTTADPSFAINPPDIDRSNEILFRESISNNHRPKIGISIRRWHFPGCSNPKERYQNYLKVMAGLIAYLTEKYGANIILIPMCTSPNKEENDCFAIDEMLSTVGNKERVRVIASEYLPEELSAIIGRMDMFIGTRMHANILALLNGVPLIAIAYEPKTEGIMKLMGLERWVLQIESIRLNELLQKVEEMWKHRNQLRKIFDAKAMVKRSQFSAILVKKLLYQY